jgi:flagellar biosynthesis/type III secretory pathway protein FliH|tara:strand:+ start:9944 stop:10264 length:321 start_codon:yes stop_codon:yes gene_type:complete
MITKEIEVNGSKFKITLTDQVISQVDNLKSLYATAADDPEVFEDVSSEISTTINQIASTVTPEVSDSYLDGLIQEVFKAVEDKKSEVEKQIKDKDAKITRKKLKAN